MSAGGLARVLPYLAHGNAAAQAALLDHYASCLDLTALDAAGPDTPSHQVRPLHITSPAEQHFRTIAGSMLVSVLSPCTFVYGQDELWVLRL